MSSSDIDLSDAVGDMVRFFMLTATLDMFCVGRVLIFVECQMSLNCLRVAWIALPYVCM